MSDHSEQIFNLLDGELDSMHESKLFAELAVNADLRAEFKQQMAIRSAVQQDRAALVPPVALTSSVFSGLGFAAPLAGAAAGAAGGGFLLQWLMRIGLPLLSSVAVAGITYSVVNSTQSTPITQQQPTTAAPVAPEAAEQPVAPLPVTTGRLPTANRSQAPAELTRLRNENASLRRQLAAAQERVSESSIEMQSEPPVQRVNVTSSMDVRYGTDQRAVQQTMLTPISNSLLKYPAFLVQVRGMSANSLTEVSAPAQTSWYDNLSVGLLYQLSEQSAVGVEFGNEAFAMSFEGQRNGQTILYEQQPLSMWAGVTYRHTFPALGNSGFSPFGQVLVGGSKFGPLGRLSAGMIYSPAGPLSFIFGLEGSTMAYQFENAWYGSSKIGLTYGVAIRF